MEQGPTEVSKFDIFGPRKNYKTHMMVCQKFWFLKPQLLINQQKTINNHHGFDRFFPVKVLTTLVYLKTSGKLMTPSGALDRVRMICLMHGTCHIRKGRSNTQHDTIKHEQNIPELGKSRTVYPNTPRNY